MASVSTAIKELESRRNTLKQEYEHNLSVIENAIKLLSGPTSAATQTVAAIETAVSKEKPARGGRKGGAGAKSGASARSSSGKRPGRASSESTQQMRDELVEILRSAGDSLTLQEMVSKYAEAHPEAGSNTAKVQQQAYAIITNLKKQNQVVTEKKPESKKNVYYALA
jgi:hypothetical protein